MLEDSDQLPDPPAVQEKKHTIEVLMDGVSVLKKEL